MPDSAPVRRSTKHLVVLFSCLAGYLGLAATSGSSVDDEVFPFFNWHLYSSVESRVRSSIGLRLVEIDGEPVEPFYFEQRPGVIPQANSPDAVVLLQRWGRQVLSGDEAGAEASRALFEGRFLRTLGSARYELVRRTFHLLERVSCEDCYLREEVIGAYELGQPG